MRAHDAASTIRSEITDLEPEAAYRLGMRLFKSFHGSDRPTAIYATSDTIAIGLMQAAYQSGVGLPGRPVDRRLRRHRLRGLHHPAADDRQPGRRARWAAPPPS